MKYFFLIFISFSLLKSCGQAKHIDTPISKDVNNIVKKIEKINKLMSEAVYYGGTKPEQWDNFMELRKKASKNELIALTDHSNAVVRCYSFWALSLDSTSNLFPIILKHIDDEEKASTQFGCIGSSEMVGDFFINVATPRRIDLDSKKLTALERQRLDSILINTPNKLNQTYYAIQEAKPTEQIYPRIRELAVKHDQSALVKLAEYKKEQDINLILENKEKDEDSESGYAYTYRAIEKFPHPRFFPLLKTNLYKTFDNDHYSNEWKALYAAIAAYKNQEALELLKVPLTKAAVPDIRSYHIDFIFSAVSEYKNSLYDNFLWELWANENKISKKIYLYLSEKDPEKAFELTKKNLSNSQPVTSVFSAFFGDDEDDGETEDMAQKKSLTTTMLDLVIKKDKEFALGIICKQIGDANVHVFPEYSEKVRELKDPSFVEPLFKRFETEWNAHVYLEVAKTLISYKDADINKRILSTLKINKELSKDWGAEALNKLLVENGIK